jgi:hypothetical protein
MTSTTIPSRRSPAISLLLETASTRSSSRECTDVSYIRATSNPEGLYITTDEDGLTTLWTGDGWKLSNIGPHDIDKRGRRLGITVLDEDFMTVCVRWRYCDVEPVEVNGLRVEEQHIFTETGLRVLTSEGASADTTFAIKVSFGDRYAFLWRVTWEYVVNSACQQARWRASASRASRKSKPKKREAE